ncbi:MAG: phosphoenolpyruvate synthase [Candidatus Wildermuthbacteria bacterium GWA2_46_15]|uniref:Phosphoenolpyruvate synthase n=1 Tax=Candidatus Wildermuthbacteria bacterium GWA2_46_15 TaxID=1802443 RepID=A0A1G2QPV9_9BACT|nr:MAG: phosphoenolpyruvate synthase [Candidatus Wildermuthbacteria bacterium GWA2_46_15]
MKQKSQKHILWFNEISKGDVPLVGGKNASLGEMFSKLSSKGINVPDGFALTSQAYWYFIETNGLQKKLEKIFRGFNPQSIQNLQKTGKECRTLIMKARLSQELKAEISRFYRKLSARCRQKEADVAVRTSGVAEDSPTTSFAGQFETFLNVKGEKKLFSAVKQSLTSTFTDRAIAYREENKIPQLKFALSIGIQKMIRSDLGSSGIMFTLDTESGFPDIVLINSIWGVGEMIVKGKITPDEFQVFETTLKQGLPAIIVKNLGRKRVKYVYNKNGGLKEVETEPREKTTFSITDQDILQLAKWACLIEKHYGKEQDIEWAKDGKTGQLFIVQSRPETIEVLRAKNIFEEYQIKTKAEPILKGIAVGNKIGKGKARVIPSILEIKQFKFGEVLVAKMTDPDWLPAMRRASAIITDEGGRTCHSAIVARELGIPAIVGTKTATQDLKNGQILTIDCSSGEGRIFAGNLDFKINTYNLKKIPKTRTKIMINLLEPQSAFKSSFLPSAGVGLARIEFIIAEKIKIHPLALFHFNKLKDKSVKKEIEKIAFGYQDKRQYFIDELAEGISQIAAGFWPRPVIVRLSDLKTNEYRALIGGELFEPKEENPMLGLRGASRYYDQKFQPAFEMECRALKKAREVFGLKNIKIMVPFCRTPEEGKIVLDLMEKFGLVSEVYVMAEIPSNVILVEKFLDIFDGMSIGSNDLTQLVLGLDRDNADLAHIADERNEAVKEMISKIIKLCKKKKKYVGICGDAPSTFPDFAEFLVKEGIDSISVSPDVLIKTIINVAKVEKNV